MSRRDIFQWIAVGLFFWLAFVLLFSALESIVLWQLCGLWETPLGRAAILFLGVFTTGLTISCIRDDLRRERILKRSKLK